MLIYTDKMQVSEAAAEKPVLPHSALRTALAARLERDGAMSLEDVIPWVINWCRGQHMPTTPEAAREEVEKCMSEWHPAVIDLGKVVP